MHVEATTQNPPVLRLAAASSPFGTPGPPTKRRVGDRAPPTPPLPHEQANSTPTSLSSLGTSPVRLTPLLSLLMHYPRRTDAAYLASGFSEGFRIPYTGKREATECHNLKSARALPEVLASKIFKECEAGRVAGPFSAPPLPNLRVSPLGVVPKKTPGQFRLIHHLSYPRGSSVNDYISPELCSVKYSSLDDAITNVRECGHGALMAKCDIQSAFRLLPVYPSDYCLLGFKFEGSWYVDKAMPMGCSIACAAFEKFSTFLEWAAKMRSGSRHITHYLDDFLFTGPSGSSACADLLATFQGLAAELGVPLAGGKNCWPFAPDYIFGHPSRFRARPL